MNQTATDVAPSGKEITCLDDAPSVARQAAHQEFLNRYYKPVVMLPLMAAMLFGFTVFGENSPVTVLLVFAALIWGLAALAYHLFLIITLRCPVCGWRYGRRSKCSSCGLPRHAPLDSGISIVPQEFPQF